MELDLVLKHIHGLIVSYRDKKGLGNNEFARLAQLSNTAIKPIEGEKRTDKGKLKTIDLATLIKILNAYPELRVEVLDYLSGNTEEKPTPGVKASEQIDMEKYQQYKDLYAYAKGNEKVAQEKIARLEAEACKMLV